MLDAWTEVWLSPAFAGWNLDPHLAHVECPVLAIHGELDEYGSAAFPERIAAGVRGASQCAILSGCGHVPHREQPEQVLAMVSGFVASVEVPGQRASMVDDPALRDSESEPST